MRELTILNPSEGGRRGEEGRELYNVQVLSREEGFTVQCHSLAVALHYWGDSAHSAASVVDTHHGGPLVTSLWAMSSALTLQLHAQ